MSSDEFETIIFDDEDGDNEEQTWLTTLADLSMLLLVFFILLFSMSTLDVQKFSETFSSVQKAISGKMQEIASSTITREEAGAILDQILVKRQIVESQKKVFADVKTLNTTKGMEGVLTANFEDGLITMRLPGDVLFASGDVRLSPKGRQLIASLKDFFIQHPDQIINIKGFTDNVQPRGGRFVDNWEISSLRAVNVLRELLDLGIKPNRLTATGLADLEPLYPNSTEEFKAKNRRVEFILEKRVVGQ